MAIPQSQDQVPVISSTGNAEQERWGHGNAGEPLIPQTYENHTRWDVIRPSSPCSPQPVSPPFFGHLPYVVRT